MLIRGIGIGGHNSKALRSNLLCLDRTPYICSLIKKRYVYYFGPTGRHDAVDQRLTLM